MKEKNKKLAKNTILIFISRVCTKFISFLLLPFITAALSTNDYGNFDLISTYSWLLTPFMTLKIESGIFRFLIDERKDKENQNIIISTGVSGIFLQTFIFTFFFFIISWLFNIDYYVEIYLMALTSVIFSVLLQLCRGLGDNFTFSVASIISGVVNSVVSLILIFKFRLGINGLIFGTLIANIISSIFVIIKNKVLSYFSLKKFNAMISKDIIKYSVPLVSNSVSSWIVNASDRIMLSFFLGSGPVGIYSIANKFPQLLNNIYEVFNMAWTESASENSNENDKSLFYSNTINTVFLFLSSICLVVLAFMNVLFFVMINAKFDEAYVYVPILILATIFQILSGLYESIYISLKKSKSVAFTTVMVGTINIIINLMFMNKFGIVVACVSTLISYLVLTIYRIIDIRSLIEIKLEYKNIILVLICYLVLLPTYYYRSILCSLTGIIISIIFFIVMNRAIIFSIYDSFIKKILSRR